jgi:hypothetical protein
MDLSVEAKREYLNMLSEAMSPIMCETFVNMYKEAITRSNRHRDQVVKLFIVLLEEVTNWNNSIIATHTKEYEINCPYFTDLLAAVFVCYVKILSSIRITKDPKKLPIKLPSNSDFVHACLKNAADKFVGCTQIFRQEDAVVRSEQISTVCKRAIEKTLNDLIPIQQILRTYITSTPTFDISGNEEVQQEDTMEPDPEPEPEPEPEPMIEEQEVPPPQEEKKSIPVFFDDAAEQRPKNFTPQ